MHAQPVRPTLSAGKAAWAAQREPLEKISSVIQASSLPSCLAKTAMAGAAASDRTRHVAQPTVAMPRECLPTAWVPQPPAHFVGGIANPWLVGMQRVHCIYLCPVPWVLTPPSEQHAGSVSAPTRTSLGLSRSDQTCSHTPATGQRSSWCRTSTPPTRSISRAIAAVRRSIWQG